MELAYAAAYQWFGRLEWWADPEQSESLRISSDPATMAANPAGRAASNHCTLASITVG